MPLVINTNVAALNSQRQLVKSGEDMAQAMERLSSGKRINTAADDAAGLAISNRMTSQVRGLNQAIRNANDGISLIQTAEGALDESTNILQRMRELAIQSANGIYADKDRATLDAEVQQLLLELDRIAESTSFNGQKLLDGTLGNVDLQIGAEANQTIGFSIQAMNTRELGLGSTSGDLTGDRIDPTASIDEGDVIINGVALSAHDFANDNLEDLLNDINESVDGVSAEGFNIVQAENVGTGALSGDQALQITLGSINGQPSTSYMVQNTADLDELVAAINSTTGGNVTANISDSGTLVLANSTGGDISVAVDDDITDGGGSFAVNETVAFTLEGLTGFSEAVNTGAETFTGSLSLVAEEGTTITVTKGPNGTDADLAALGFREVTAGEVQGSALSSGAQGTALAIGDLKLNGVAIAPTLAIDGLQGKVDNINEVSEQTGVTAAITAEESYSFDALASAFELASTAGFVSSPNVAYESVQTTASANAAALAVSAGAVIDFDIKDMTGLITTVTLTGAEFSSNSAVVAGMNADLLAASSGVEASLDTVTGNIIFRDVNGDGSAPTTNVTIASGGFTLTDSGGTALTVASTGAGGTYAPGTLNAALGFDVEGLTVASADTVLVGSGPAFDINGVQIDLATAKNNDGTITVEELATAVNGQSGSTGVEAFIDNDGKLHLVSTNAFTIEDDDNSTGFVETIDGGNVFTDNAAGVNATASAGSVIINGSEVSLTDLDDLEQVVTDLNSAKANTGVSASIDENGELKLQGNAAITLELGTTFGHATSEILGLGLTIDADGDAAATTLNAAIELTSINPSSPISIEVTDNGEVATGFVDMNTDLSSLVTGTALASINVSTQAAAQSAIDPIDNALETINATRSEMGAVTNRLEFTMSNLMNVAENTTAARSRIMDADFAAETANLSRAQVLQQASQAMLAQANAQPQQVLQLLNG